MPNAKTAHIFRHGEAIVIAEAIQFYCRIWIAALGFASLAMTRARFFVFIDAAYVSF